MLVSNSPRLDEPDFTVPADRLAGQDGEFATAVAALADDYGAADPLPDLLEPSAATESAVSSPIDEPLVAVAHRRVRVLSNYWHAGWSAAIPETYLRSDAMRRLTVAADKLPEGWGLAVFDAWRPLELQQQLFDAAYADPSTEPDFMAPVSHDPSTPPPHYSGGAVDLTLTYLGQPLALGSGFDDPTDAAFTSSLEGVDTTESTLRRVLYRLMADVGFVVFAFEWWHFEYGTRRWAAITGQEPFYGAANPNEQISRS